MRKAILVTLVVGAVAFALSEGAPSANATGGGKDVEICWNGETLTVKLWQFNNGDFPGATLGPCPDEPPPPDEEEPPCDVTNRDGECYTPPCGVVEKPSCDPPPQTCEEDMPCWDCETMGNKGCGGIGTPKGPVGGSSTGGPPSELLPHTGMELWWALAGLVLIGVGFTLRRLDRRGVQKP